MRISEVAKLTGLPISTIRYYEKSGLIPDEYMRRDSNHYRIYESDIVRHLDVVKTCLAVGFSIQDVKSMIAKQGLTREEQTRILRDKIAELEEAQHKLAAAKRSLTDILESSIWCEKGFGKH